jgi:hypothetical protein
VRGLRKFDLRFEDRGFQSCLERSHYSDGGLGRQFGACIQVLKQICQTSASDQDATCQNWYINRLNDVKLHEVVDEMIGQILMDYMAIKSMDLNCDGESGTEEAESQSVWGL